MSSSIFDRRRSERFAELLNEASRRRSGATRHLGRPAARRSRHRHRSKPELDLRPLVDLADRVSTLTVAPTPTEEFRTGLRAMLMATVAREGVGAVAQNRSADTIALGALAGRTQAVRQVPATGTGRTRAAVLVGVTAGALALSGVSAASTDSLPGDPLYQVKRSSERAQLALAGSDQTRGQLYLEFAHSRLAEARRVDADHLPSVLADMDAETVAGVYLIASAAVQRGDATILDALMSFVDVQRSMLDQVHRTLTVAGVEPMRRSYVLLDDITRRARALGTALARGCVISAIDRLGPNPAC